MNSATSGAHQGFVFGHLFLLLFDDVPAAIHNSTFLLYAGDIKIFKEIQNISDGALVQCDIAVFFSWCNTNKLIL